MGQFKLCKELEDGNNFIYTYEHLGNGDSIISWVNHRGVNETTNYGTDNVEHLLARKEWIEVNTKQDTLRLIKQHLCS
jgi:hypothetical protein